MNKTLQLHNIDIYTLDNETSQLHNNDIKISISIEMLWTFIKTVITGTHDNALSHLK